MEQFSRAARLSREAGCDAVEIHAAHGFLIDSFINPARNHGTDGYGGDLAGRLRLVTEVVQAVVAVVGPDVPVLLRFNNRSADAGEAARFGVAMAQAGWPSWT